MLRLMREDQLSGPGEIVEEAAGSTARRLALAREPEARCGLADERYAEHRRP